VLFSSKTTRSSPFSITCYIKFSSWKDGCRLIHEEISSHRMNLAVKHYIHCCTLFEKRWFWFTPSSYPYRAFHNVLRDYKHLL